MTNERNCENCAHAHPFGGWYDNRCDVWECEYIDRQEAIEAYKVRILEELLIKELLIKELREFKAEE